MRVLYVNHTGLLSGAEMSLLAVARALPTAHQALVASPDGPFAERVRGLGIGHEALPDVAYGLSASPIEASRFVRAAGTTQRHLRRLLYQYEPDLVHANSIRAGMQVLGAMPTRPFALCVHVRDAVGPQHVGRLLTAMTFKASDQTIFVSDYVRRQLGVRPSHANRVIYNGIDLAHFRSDRGRKQDARRSRTLGGPFPHPVLLLPAQLTEWKGQTEAVRILSIIRNEFPAAQLILAGEMKNPTPKAHAANLAFMERLKALITELGLERAVQLVGHVDNIEDIYRLADVVLVPSRQEPFGRTVIEAMAAGKLVIATSEGGPSEIIEDKRTGFLLPPDQPELWATAVANILADPGMMLAVELAAKEAVGERFTAERYVKGCLAAYEAALHASRGRRKRHAWSSGK